MLTIEETLVIVGGLCVRAMMSIHPHSGQATPPMYGDYEAQRHWQEVTVNLPISEWYFDTKDNNLAYWGLDYPPLTAYHSWVVGKMAMFIDPSYVKLNDSRGVETPPHKNFMRSTVLLSDLFVLVPAAVAFGRAAHIKSVNGVSDSNIYKSLVTTSLLVTYPGLILIDNGHFQYNNMSLGLLIAAVACLFNFKDCLASILFVAALNYKQMELYHALPFFFYLLGRCILCSSWSQSIGKLATIGITVIATFVIIWLPFLILPMSDDPVLQIKQMAHRLFPIGRGIFEDKVSNFWCAANVLVKIQHLYPADTLALVCAVTTGLFSLPSNIILFLKPTRQNLLLTLINTSLVFFLFSFQVHEKSILLVAIPLVMYLGRISSPSLVLSCNVNKYKDAGLLKAPGFFQTRHSSLVSVWFLSITVFSMFPLLQRDMLSLPTLSLLGCFLILCHYFNLMEPNTKLEKPTETYVPSSGGFVSSPLSTSNTPTTGSSKTLKGRRSPVPKLLSETELESQNWSWIDWIWWTAFNLSMVGCFVIAVASVRVAPPKHLPHLWPLLISVFCAIHFIIFGIYYHVLQLRYYYGTGITFDSIKTENQINNGVLYRWTERSVDVLLESKKNL